MHSFYPQPPPPPTPHPPGSHVTASNRFESCVRLLLHLTGNTSTKHTHGVYTHTSTHNDYEQPPICLSLCPKPEEAHARGRRTRSTRTRTRPNRTNPLGGSSSYTCYPNTGELPNVYFFLPVVFIGYRHYCIMSVTSLSPKLLIFC